GSCQDPSRGSFLMFARHVWLDKSDARLVARPLPRVHRAPRGGARCSPVASGTGCQGRYAIAVSAAAHWPPCLTEPRTNSSAFSSRTESISSSRSSTSSESSSARSATSRDTSGATVSSTSSRRDLPDWAWPPVSRVAIPVYLLPPQGRSANVPRRPGWQRIPRGAVIGLAPAPGGGPARPIAPPPTGDQRG